MSADNGIYTLITAAPGGGKEYRVAYGSAIENIFADRICMDGCCAPKWHPGVKLELNYAYAYFSEAPVFTNQKAAEDYAQKLEDRETYEYEGVRYGTEYGCVTFDHGDVPFPELSMVLPVRY